MCISQQERSAHTLSMYTNACDMLCALGIRTCTKWEPVRKRKYSFPWNSVISRFYCSAYFIIIGLVILQGMQFSTWRSRNHY
jgi:hypothetical protein